MSRSYKHTAGWTQSSGCTFSRYMKRYANRCLRRKKSDENLRDGSYYRRFSGVEQYTICDYKFLYFSKNAVLYAVKEKGSLPYHRYYMK